jgi:hypothetical protein
MKRRSFLRALLSDSAAAVIAAMAGPVQLGRQVLVHVIDPAWVVGSDAWDRCQHRRLGTRAVRWAAP